MRSIERCRRRERLDEKIDPFMRRWGLQELSALGQDDDTDDASFSAQAVSSTDLLADFNYVPKKMEHLVTCDCNPCTCAMNEESASELFLYSPMKVRIIL
jgi:hypothetical protein